MTSHGGFHALTQFCHGYLHEDFLAEHGSARAAADTFRAQSTAVERRKVVHEWDLVKKQAGGSVAAALQRLEQLGCRWHPSTPEQIDGLFNRLRE
jgi:hypothetical protein